MRHYETMFIVKPTLVEEEIKERIEFFKNVILKNNGDITITQDMGMRNLAYTIKKQNRGYYFLIYFKAEPTLIAELERLYRISEDILRFIVIKYESKKEIKQWEILIDRVNKKPGSYKGFKKEREDRGERPSYDRYKREYNKDFSKDFKDKDTPGADSRADQKSEVIIKQVDEKVDQKLDSTATLEGEL